MASESQVNVFMIYRQISELAHWWIILLTFQWWMKYNWSPKSTNWHTGESSCFLYKELMVFDVLWTIWSSFLCRSIYFKISFYLNINITLPGKFMLESPHPTDLLPACVLMLFLETRFTLYIYIIYMSIFWMK